jgi:hypothetical protein
MKNYYVTQNNASIGRRTDVQTFVGEWAFQTKFGDATNILDLHNMKFVLNLCKANGYAIAYWALGAFAAESGDGNFKRLCNPDGTLRQEGRTYSQAIKEVYG